MRLSIILFTLFTFMGHGLFCPNSVHVTVSTEEYELYQLIMDYRIDHGLPSIPLSSSLTLVAQAHSLDLVENAPDLSTGCNAHSWSDRGPWKSCCYDDSGSNPDCMWEKPKELSDYPGFGFEIAAGSSEDKYKKIRMTPERAMHGWMFSPAHNCVLINLDAFENIEWNAIGVGLIDGFACVWFGQQIDDLPPPTILDR